MGCDRASERAVGVVVSGRPIVVEAWRLCADGSGLELSGVTDVLDVSAPRQRG